MSYNKVHDILELVQSFHHNMQEALEQIQQDSHSIVVEWLSDQIRRYEQHWQAALADYEKYGAQDVLGTWLQFVPDETIRKEINSITVNSDMTLEELAEINMRFRNALIDLYQTLATASAAPRVQELFQQLLEQERAVVAHQSFKTRESVLVESETCQKKE
ncbi:hypothetical protein [Gimesia fumaroli]|jgi:uncharacterized membrane-anchored protein YjiN (DUF445 family)|uniref:DUF2383 domain-containing protein n=1 Tax=Gimesia fumaroli TaxID=2527976 RepID=A0A518I8L1_9PLAN|nr:hypothetical protein [Gimesia fumaroli]QDV49417.1 hypothetical protein Enr17x_14340 [Gimesia fumaroli]